MKRLPTLLTALALAALAGCAATGPQAPAHAMRDFGTGAPGWPDPARDGAVWSTWHDAQLERLIATALAEQPTMQVAELRLRQAGFAADVAGAATQPQLQLAGDSTNQHFTANSIYPYPLGGGRITNNDLQLEGSWELDLFGRNRALLDAALGQQHAAQADVQAAKVLLAANVSAAYVNLAHQLELQGIVQAAVAEREQVAAIVRQRVGSGLDTQVDARQADGAVAQARLDLASLDEQIARTRHALAELCGQAPDAYAALTPAMAPLATQALPATLPADLIGRRADVVAQRWRVEASQRDVAAARTLFYPNVDIRAFAGFSALGTSRFLEASSRNYGAGPALSLPLFEGGRLRANLGAKSAEADVAIENYNATVLRALHEAADEATSLRAIEAQQRDQADALAAAEAAFDLATQRYKAGLGNFLVVLTAEGNVLAQRRSASDLKSRHLLSEINLSRALGGGVTAEAPVKNPAESPRS